MHWFQVLGQSRTKYQFTVKQIVQSYRKNHQELSNSLLSITTSKNQEFILNQCCIFKEKELLGLFPCTRKTLLFVKKTQSKVLVGHTLLTDQKVNVTNKDFAFQQFVQQSLTLKATFVEADILKQATFDKQKKISEDQQVFDYFLFVSTKSNQSWKFIFQEQGTARLWQKLLNGIKDNQCKLHEDKSASSRSERLQNSKNIIEKSEEQTNEEGELLSQTQLHLINEVQALKQKQELVTKELQDQKSRNLALQTTISELRARVRSQEAAKTKLIQDATKRDLQLESNRRTVNKLTIDLENLSQTIESLKKQNKNLQTKLTQSQNAKQYYQQQLRQANSKVAQISATLQEAKLNNTKNQKLLLRKNDEIDIQAKNITQLRESGKQLQREVQKLTLQNENLRRQKQKQIQKVSQQIEQLHIQNYLHIFEGHVLHEYISEKEFLRNSIESYTKKKIQYTNLLYRFDNLNKANFHKYIDEHPHICIVIKLQNGMSIAGYSEDPISPQKVASKGGILCSLTNMTVFELIKGCRSVTYDDFFLIFGNSELRIRFLQLILFSNFAINNGYYDARGQKYNILMGSGASRTERVVSYEVFQVIFK